MWILPEYETIALGTGLPDDPKFRRRVKSWFEEGVVEFYWERLRNQVWQALTQAQRKEANGCRYQAIANALGVDPATVFRWVKKLTRPGLELYLICQSVFGITLDIDRDDAFVQGRRCAVESFRNHPTTEGWLAIQRQVRQAFNWGNVHANPPGMGSLDAETFDHLRRLFTSQEWQEAWNPEIRSADRHGHLQVAAARILGQGHQASGRAPEELVQRVQDLFQQWFVAWSVVMTTLPTFAYLNGN
jgi:hypothetical protein